MKQKNKSEEQVPAEPTVNEFCFTAIRGIQAGRPFYAVMCPLGMVSRILDYEGSKDTRRRLFTAAIPKIANYIVKQTKSYVLSSIAVAIGGEFEFRPHSGSSDHGQLLIPMTTPLLVNDGQHRCAAIRDAVAKKPSLTNETISVVFTPDPGLEQSDQMFDDLNRRY